mgnify:CR=1 FL=1
MVKDKKYYSQRATRFVRGIRPGPLPSHLLFSHASKNASHRLMKLRPYRADDCVALVQLFRDTVHTVNARDYTLEQLAVWPPTGINLEKWQRSLSTHHSGRASSVR